MTASTRTIGKWMIWLSWLMVLGLLSLFFNNQLEKRHNPNQQVDSNTNGDGVIEVVLTRNVAGHYVSSGFINNTPVIFLLDTGASDVSIPAAIAKRIGLQQGQAVIYQTANGKTRGYRTTLDTISIGDIQLNNIRGGITPSMQGEFILLGMTFLKHLEFSQRGNKLTIRQYPNE